MTLDFGQRGANFALPAEDGGPATFYDRFTGNSMLLVFCRLDAGRGSLMPLAALAERAALLATQRCAVLLIGSGDAGQAGPVAVSLAEVYPLLTDPAGRIAEAYGLQEALAANPCQALLLDRNQRLLAAFAGPEDIAGQLLTYLETAAIDHGSGRRLGTALAPAMLLPNVLDPPLCAKAIEAFEADHHEGLIGTGAPPATADGGSAAVAFRLKKRLDHFAEPPLNSALQKAVERRLGPEMLKAYHFKLGRVERFCIGAYEAERADYFRPHRDNTTAKSRDRRYAVTLNLNDDFTGGGLRFPEFSDDVFNPPAGGALVFSCSLMHEAMPVTAGSRYVALTFLYDPLP